MVRRVEAPVEDRVSQLSVILACKRSDERRILSQNNVRRVLVRGQEGVDEADLRRASDPESYVTGGRRPSCGPGGVLQAPK